MTQKYSPGVGVHLIRYTGAQLPKSGITRVIGSNAEDNTPTKTSPSRNVVHSFQNRVQGRGDGLARLGGPPSPCTHIPPAPPDLLLAAL